MLRYGILCLLVALALGAASDDEVKDLPGLSAKPNFKHYSGYLAATGSKQFHYWFVESQRTPSTDPLVLWLNGGPGCSSLAGLLIENGPFRINIDGKTVEKNPHSWNTIANILYLESPAGVGFSYSGDKNYTTSDDEVAMDNYAALKSFMMRFPQFAKHQFFIFGESYGGIYIPTLTMKVMEDRQINFQGFGIGNGLLDDNMNDNSRLYFGYFHGLFGKSDWQNLLKNCKCNSSQLMSCDFAGNKSPECQSEISIVTSHIDSVGLNPYNIYGECITTSVLRNSMEATIPSHRFLYKDNQFVHARTQRLRATSKTIQEVPPCANLHAIDMYLNSMIVKEALHIAMDATPWQACSSSVSLNYQRQYTSMKSQFMDILKSGRIRTLVFNGDVDSVCNFMGDEWFTDSLNLSLKEARKSWSYTAADGTSQVAGTIKQFVNLNYVTIRGAGHMVPQDKPIVALQMFHNFLINL